MDPLVPHTAVGCAPLSAETPRSGFPKPVPEGKTESGGIRASRSGSHGREAVDWQETTSIAKARMREVARYDGIVSRAPMHANTGMPNGFELSGPAKSRSHYRAAVAGSAPASG